MSHDPASPQCLPAGLHLCHLGAATQPGDAPVAEEGRRQVRFTVTKVSLPMAGTPGPIQGHPSSQTGEARGRDTRERTKASAQNHRWDASEPVSLTLLQTRRLRLRAHGSARGCERTVGERALCAWSANLLACWAVPYTPRGGATSGQGILGSTGGQGGCGGERVGGRQGGVEATVRPQPAVPRAGSHSHQSPPLGARVQPLVATGASPQPTCPSSILALPSYLASSLALPRCPWTPSPSHPDLLPEASASLAISWGAAGAWGAARLSGSRSRPHRHQCRAQGGHPDTPAGGGQVAALRARARGKVRRKDGAACPAPAWARGQRRAGHVGPELHPGLSLTCPQPLWERGRRDVCGRSGGTWGPASQHPSGR